MKKEKESWINNFLNFQLVFGSARFREILLKMVEYKEFLLRNVSYIIQNLMTSDIFFFFIYEKRHLIIRLILAPYNKIKLRKN